VNYNFVIEWNEIVKTYRNLLAQRAGRRAKKNAAGVLEPAHRPVFCAFFALCPYLYIGMWRRKNSAEW
jgi:hypothetical protein